MKQERHALKLQGQVALITGGAKGIGRKIALLFAQEGADLVLVGPNPAELGVVKKEVESLGQRCIARKVDVAQNRQVDVAVKAALKEFHHIDILINNASVLGPTAPIVDLFHADWKRELAVNLTGAFLCTKAVLLGMVERKKGKIINISSVAGQRAYLLRSPYAVSKAGLMALTRTLAGEVGPQNIQVNAVAPGPVRGRRMERVIEERAKATGATVEQMEKSYLENLALGRMVEEVDVARMVLFLASHEGDNITGQVFNVCSGYKL